MPKKEQTIPPGQELAVAKFNTINGQKIHMEDVLKRELGGKRVAIFVSILSNAFRPLELDAMLAALYHKGVQQVDLVVVDGLQGLNINGIDCSQMSEDQIRGSVFNQGEGAARCWVAATAFS